MGRVTGLHPNAVYDLKTKNKKIFNIASDIIVLTNNSYLDILKTIGTLHNIYSLLENKDIKIHIVFNRLQPGTAVDREKKYTKESRTMIKENSFGLNISFSYIRTNLAFYRGIKDGKFFMDTFFKHNNEYMRGFPSILQELHVNHLKQMVKKKYEKNFDYDFRQMRSFENLFNLLYNKRDSKFDKIGEAHIQYANKKIANTIYDGNYIDNSRNALKDMYLLLCDLGIYDDPKFEKKLKKTYE